jgi:hypothetical protein
MKKILVYLLLSLFFSKVVFADIGLDCYTENYNTRDTETKKIKYNKVLPSQFTVSIEELGRGKVIARTFPGEDSGSICSPFIGDVSDARVKMKCLHDLKYPKAGNDFLLDRYTGNFTIEAYAVDRKYGWYSQKTGTCKWVEKKF